MTADGPSPLTGPPPCLYGRVCHYDAEAGCCPCEADEPLPEPRLTVTLKPVGSYL